MPWRTSWAQAALWLLKRLKLVWTIPVPWLRTVSGVMVPTPLLPHRACLWPLGFTFPLCAPSAPPECQFHFLLVFIKFATTFHLGGLHIKTSFLEMGQQAALRLGQTCPEGTVCNTDLPPRAPQHCHLQGPRPRSSGGSGEDAPPGRLRAPSSPQSETALASCGAAWPKDRV